jgi:hypothetical protein
MPSRLVNVRLDERRLEKARRLRARGIPLSKLVRDAIDREYEQFLKPQHADVEAIMQEIYERHPDPSGLPSRNYDIRNGRQAGKAVLQKLSRKRR